MAASPAARASSRSRVDLGFGADIDTGRRLLEDQDSGGSVAEPTADHDLLLVSA